MEVAHGGYGPIAETNRSASGYSPGSDRLPVFTVSAMLRTTLNVDPRRRSPVGVTTANAAHAKPMRTELGLA